MKKILLLAIFGLTLSFSAMAQTAPEQVQVIDAKIAINQDGTVNIRENISYNFGATEHHGIFRNIPYKYKRNGLNYNLDITKVRVTDFDGSPYQFTTSKQSGNFEIKIGDPNQFVTGQKNYRIEYTVRGAINFFNDHDEFYWNVVGSGWIVPILGTSADVKLPPGALTSKSTADCFGGDLGAQVKCLNINTYGDSYSFSGDRVLPGQAFTVVVGFPKGVVHQPTVLENLWYTLKSNLIFLLPLVALLAMWWVWNKYGKDPKPSIPRVAQYEAPDNLTPAEVGFLAIERTNNSFVAAEIIDLAVRGYLKIERIPKEGMFGHEDFKLIKLKDEKDLTNFFDRNLLAMLFALGPSEVLISSLKNKGKATATVFGLNTISKKMTDDGYFIQEPNVARMKYIASAAIALGIIVYFLLSYLSAPVFVSLLATGIIVIVFGYFMPKKTQKGADTQQLIYGLRDYISVAEKDRLDFHNDPAKDPKTFEKLLPYAIALGVSEAWAKKFEGLGDYHPNWYSDPTHTYFNFVVFNGFVGNFNHGLTSAMAASASAAGSGRSGFGGGGFSGGGFGGGGGGSW